MLLKAFEEKILKFPTTTRIDPNVLAVQETILQQNSRVVFLDFLANVAIVPLLFSNNVYACVMRHGEIPPGEKS